MKFSSTLSVHPRWLQTCVLIKQLKYPEVVSSVWSPGPNYGLSVTVRHWTWHHLSSHRFPVNLIQSTWDWDRQCHKWRTATSWNILLLETVWWFSCEGIPKFETVSQNGFVVRLESVMALLLFIVVTKTLRKRKYFVRQERNQPEGDRNNKTLDSSVLYSVVWWLLLVNNMLSVQLSVWYVCVHHPSPPSPTPSSLVKLSYIPCARVRWASTAPVCKLITH